MSEVYFVSHPEVIIDKHVPVPEWDLSEVGLSRLEKLLKQPWLTTITSVYSSNEKKAKTTALRIANTLSLDVTYREDLGEMDRSSTGMLPPEEFNEVVEEFFQNPEQSIRGWERAIDAQKRIVETVKEVISKSPGGNIAIVSHGGVGALLLSYLKRTTINRSEDQPSQGHYFVFDRDNVQLVSRWKPIDLLD